MEVDSNQTESGIQSIVFLPSNFYGTAPSFLKEIVSKMRRQRDLRSSEAMLLSVPRTSTTVGDRAVGIFGAKLWNNLPADLKEERRCSRFRKLLFEHLCDRWVNDFV